MKRLSWQGVAALAVVVGGAIASAVYLPASPLALGLAGLALGIATKFGAVHLGSMSDEDGEQ